VGINLKELVGLWLVVIALGLVIGAAFMASTLAGMFVSGGILMLVGSTLIYAGLAQERAQLAAKAAETTSSVRGVA
jgi:hypothetical protein